MRTSTLDAIRAISRKAGFSEACGFIVSRNGRETVLEVPNAHPDPVRNFSIAPRSYLEAKKQGELLACWHSHPEGGLPSDIDIAACSRTGLVWYVYLVPEDRVETVRPSGVLPLKGRPFIWGVYDCWTLVYDYYRETLSITLPDWEPYEVDFWKSGRNYYVERYASFGFVPVEDLRPHDVVLMQLGTEVPVHAGVYQENGTVLHHVPGRLSTADVYGTYLRRSTNLILRHGSRI